MDAPVCYVVPGQERLVARAIGPYQLQECGFFEACDEVTRQYYEGEAGWDYVELWRCGPDTQRLVIALVLATTAIVATVVLVRRRLRPNGFSPVQPDDDLFA